MSETKNVFNVSTVRTPILLVLLQRDKIPDKSVSLAVLNHMKLTVEDVGITRAGTPRYLSIVTNALSNLDAEGLVSLEGVEWSLTRKGQNLAKWCQHTNKLECDWNIEHKAIHFWEPPHIPIPYSDDEDINQMVFSQQPCAGKYNPLEPTCNNPLNPCPFVRVCSKMTAQAFEQLFKEPLEEAPQPFKLFHASHELRVSKFSVVCECCRNVIKTQSSVVVLSGHGTVHQECYGDYWKMLNTFS